jgi:hypothetical protein
MALERKHADLFDLDAIPREWAGPSNESFPALRHSPHLDSFNRIIRVNGVPAKILLLGGRATGRQLPITPV